MSADAPAYGLWLLVFVNLQSVRVQPLQASHAPGLALFRCFQCPVALFTETYGFPLTIFLLSGWLQTRFLQIDWLCHDAGHTLLALALGCVAYSPSRSCRRAPRFASSPEIPPPQTRVVDG